METEIQQKIQRDGRRKETEKRPIEREKHIEKKADKIE